MRAKAPLSLALLGVAAAVGVAVGAYAVLAATAWRGYGHPRASMADEQDDLLDRFMPSYDVVERHHIRVAAPAAITLQTAKEQDLRDSVIVRGIFRAREAILHAASAERARPRGLLAEVQSLGWGVLADVPDHEIVLGAVTKPWEANVTFTALPPAKFAAFSQPGFVKIVWTLRADPVDAAGSVFLTETRAIATDAAARTAFRRYWAFASPGITLIRRMSLHLVRREAERRAAVSGTATRHPRRSSF